MKLLTKRLTDTLTETNVKRLTKDLQVIGSYKMYNETKQPIITMI